MIAIVCIIIGIAMFAAAGNGEWGSVAVGAVIVVVLLCMGGESRKCDRAFNNHVDYWANGGHMGSRKTRL